MLCSLAEITWQEVTENWSKANVTWEIRKFIATFFRRSWRTNKRTNPRKSFLRTRTTSSAPSASSGCASQGRSTPAAMVISSAPFAWRAPKSSNILTQHLIKKLRPFVQLKLFLWLFNGLAFWNFYKMVDNIDSRLCPLCRDNFTERQPRRSIEAEQKAEKLKEI